MADKTRTNTAPSRLVRNRPRPMALEQRFVFDGAAAADAVDAIADDGGSAARASINVAAAAEAPSIVFNAPPEASSAFTEAQADASRMIGEFLSTADNGTLFNLFNGGRSSPDSDWQAAADAWLNSLRDGTAQVKVELRSHDELQGALGAFAASGPTGSPTVFVNADWVALASDKAMITRVLVEEAGHAIDYAINGPLDTAGDEGEAFAAAVYGIELSAADAQRIRSENDSREITLDGISYEVEEAAVTFTQVFKITPVSQSEEANSFITDPLAVSGTGFRFTSSDPSAPYFSGNNVSGVLSWTDSQSGETRSVFGVVSRLIKSGSRVDGLYFYAPGADGVIGTGNDDSAYVLRVNETFNFTGATNYRTSSDPVDTAMNKFIQPNQAPNVVNDSATVLEDSLAPLTGNLLTNDSDPDGDPLRVSQITVNGTAHAIAAGSQVTLSLAAGSLTVASNGQYSFQPATNYAGAVPTVGYLVTDGKASAVGSLILTIVPVNDAPEGTDRSVAIKAGASYTFSAADFGFRDPNDSPAHTLAAVRISSLPTNGTLYFKGVALTAGQIATGYEVAVGELTQLTFVASQSNGTASFGFQVRDDGTTANGGIDLDPTPNTFTFNVSIGNRSPVVIGSVTGEAVEAGGVANGTSGSAASGSLLDGISDPDGDSLTLASVGTTVVSANGATQISGLYGTLSVSADGAYSYQPNDSAAAVQALRNGSLNETFTYSVRDPAGLSVSNTLVITIQGRNDAPVAVADFNTVKESATGYSGSTTATGNVLTNDIDVDAGDSKTVSGIVATANAITSSSVTTSLIKITNVSGFDTTKDYAVYRGTDTTTRIGTYSRGSAIVDLDGAGAGTIGTIQLDANVTVSNGESLTFYQRNGQSANFSSGSISAAAIVSGTSNTAVQLTDISGSVLVGMAVSGAGIPDGTTVTAITGSTATLSSAVSLSSATRIAFTQPVGLNGTTLTGTRGNLLLRSDGSYTYTLTDMSLPSGSTASDTFTYRMQDAAGASSTATLTIRIEGTTDNTEPDAQDAGGIAVEQGFAADGTVIGSNATGDVWNGTGSVTQAWSEAAPGTTSLSVTGQYGTLTLLADGTYVYTPTNANPTVDALALGQTLTDTFFYRVSNGAKSDVARLTITLQGANDAPVAVADTATAREASGAANSIAGFDPSGNLLANDRDVDTGDSLTLTRIGAGDGTPATPVVAGSTLASSPTSVAGNFGTLVLGADGSYRYAVDNTNVTVDALRAGQSLSDVFTYEVTDSHGKSSTATLTISIQGADDSNAPINSMPSSLSINGFDRLAIPLAVADIDGDLVSARVTVASGRLSVDAHHAALISSGSNGSDQLVLSGTQQQINDALATLSYQPGDHYVARDTLVLTSIDALGNRDTDTLSLDIMADDRDLTVSSPTVNEASPYVHFNVTGTAGQRVSLALAAGTASAGLDYVPVLEYLEGSTWITYLSGTVTLPAGGALQVRVAILGDTLNEGSETFELRARNSANEVFTGTATIIDDGTGVLFDPAGLPDSSGTLDDDRPLTVSSVEVNEGSPYAIFQVGGATGQRVALSLVNGSAVDADHGTTLQYLDGNQWRNYTGPISLSAPTLLVRVGIVDDGIYEGRETFGLVAQNNGGGSAVGTAGIYDDGTGVVFVEDNKTGNPDTAPLTDDRTLSVSSPTVNEASDWAVFTVSGDAGLSVSLSVVQHIGTGHANLGTAPTLQVWNGQEWTDYTASALPALDGQGRLLVRVDIRAEQDTGYEVAETFELLASLAPANGRAGVTGTATIVDNGNGVIYLPGAPGPDGLPTTSTLGLDNDNPGNQPSVLRPESQTIDEDSTASGNVLENDSDPDDILRVTSFSVAGTSYVPGNTATLAGIGSLVLNADGSYVFTPEADWHGSLPTVTYTTQTGASSTLDITVRSQPDAAMIGGVDTGAVTEDLNVNGQGNLTTGGTLAVTDPDAGEASFQPTVSAPAGALGTLTIAPNGTWSYSVPNSVVQYLKSGETKVETFIVRSVDGTPHTITVTVHGVNDPAQFAPSGQQGYVQEDTLLTSEGQLSVTDADLGEAVVVAQPGTRGTYGEFSIDAAGRWRYVLDNTAPIVQALGTADIRTETFAVTTADGSTTTVSITVQGLDEAVAPQLQPPRPTPPQPAPQPQPEPVQPQPQPPQPQPLPPVGVSPPQPAAPVPLPAPALPEPAAPPPAPAPFDTAVAPATTLAAPSAVAAPLIAAVQSRELDITFQARGDFGDLYTQRSGFQVVVIESPQPRLSLYHGISDQYADAGATSSFSVPYDAFAHTDPNERILLSATQANGQPLPGWVRFDPQSGKFELVAPTGYRGELTIKVVARDSQGREASALFRFSVGERRASEAGRAGLSDLLRKAAAQRPVQAMERALASPAVEAVSASADAAGKAHRAG